MTVQTAIKYLESIKDIQTPKVKNALTLVIEEYRKTHKHAYTECQYCGKPFQTTDGRGGKKYCNQTCTYNAWYTNLRKDPVRYRKRLDDQARNARKRRQGIDK